MKPSRKKNKEKGYQLKKEQGHEFKFNQGGINGKATLKGKMYMKAGQIPV